MSFSTGSSPRACSSQEPRDELVRIRVALDRRPQRLAAREPLHAEGELRHADAERDARAAGAEAVQRLQEHVGDRRRLDRARRPAARVVAHRLDDVVDLGSSATVAPSSAASCRRPGPGRRRRSSATPSARAAITAGRPTPPAPNTTSDERSSSSSTFMTVPAPVCTLQPNGAATLRSTSPPDHDHVVLVRERMGGEARLPEEGPVHRAAVRRQRRRPVGADAARVERREPRAVVRPAGGALGTGAAAPVAHDDGVARPDAFDAVADLLDDAGALVPEHDGIAPAFPAIRGQSSPHASRPCGRSRRRRA